MPQKTPQIDWETWNLAESLKQDIENVQNEMSGMTPRELYNLPSYTNVAKYLVRRPSEYAMHGTETNYPTVDPVEVIENVLIDGNSYYKVEDIEHIRRSEFVYRVDLDTWTEEITYILTCYPIEEGAFYFWESWEIETAPYEGGEVSRTCTYTQYYKTQGMDDKTADNLKVENEIVIPFLPWVKISWKHGTSLIGEVKESVVRLEAVYRIVSTTNNEGGKSYITGIDNTAKLKTTPLNFGIGVRILPPNANFVKDPVDTGRVDLLKWETDKLWDGIEKATSVVSVDKLAVLSGESRTIAEKPLLMLAEDLRKLFTDFLYEIYETLMGVPGTEEPTVSYASLRVPTQFSTPDMEVNVLDRALLGKAIDDEEWRQKIRYLLGLDSTQKTDSTPVILPDENIMSPKSKDYKQTGDK